MNTDEPIYLSYTIADGVAPFFQTLDGKEGLQMGEMSTSILKRRPALLHTRGWV